MGSAGTRGKELLPRPIQNAADFRLGLAKLLGRFGERVAHQQDILVPEFALKISFRRNVSGGLDAVSKVENSRSVWGEHLFDLLCPPDIESPFAVLRLAGFDQTICIQRGVEPAFRGMHLAENEVEDVSGRVGKERLVSDLEGLEVG